MGEEIAREERRCSLSLSVTAAGDAVASTALDTAPHSPVHGGGETGRGRITLLLVDFQNSKSISCLEMSCDYTLTIVSSFDLCQSDFTSETFSGCPDLVSWTLKTV